LALAAEIELGDHGLRSPAVFDLLAGHGKIEKKCGQTKFFYEHNAPPCKAAGLPFPPGMHQVFAGHFSSAGKNRTGALSYLATL